MYELCIPSNKHKMPTNSQNAHLVHRSEPRSYQAVDELPVIPADIIDVP